MLFVNTNPRAHTSATKRLGSYCADKSKKMFSFIYPNKPIRIYSPANLLVTLHSVTHSDGATVSNQWIVQPKMDGRRVLPYCDADGQVTLYGRLGQKFKELRPELANLNLPKPFLLDGEILRDGRIFLWDYALVDGEAAFHLPYQVRLTRLQDMVMSGVGAELVETLPATEYQSILARGKSESLEGIVFKYKLATNLFGPYQTTEVASQFKYRI